jgi:SAM-dependent methyltransferase
VPVYNERFLVERSIRRAAAFSDPLVSELEIIAVDDGSDDGSAAILDALALDLPQLRVHHHPANRGKGAAVRTAIEHATGDLCVVHDADLEYDPGDWSRLLRPFVEAQADAVYGSRFLASDYRRVLYYRHTIGNRLLTLGSNLMTDLNLTDMETCTKMVRTALLQSIPIRSDDFGFEPEITAKLAKRGAVVFEVPIRYSGRTYLEGKKITWKHGVKAIADIVRWKVRDDLYKDDEHGAEILRSLTKVQNIHRWMAELLLPWVGDHVLEIGAGIGNMTIHFLPRGRYLATDINPAYLEYLGNLAKGRPFLEVRRLDLERAPDFEALAGGFDTVLCLNVLEHVEDQQRALANIHTALAPGGRAIVLVPQGPWLYSSLDRVLHHQRRYTRAELQRGVAEAGFEVEQIVDFNKLGVLGWALNGLLLRRERFSPVQLKALNTAIPFVGGADRMAPWPGLSLVAILRKPH